MQIRTRGTSLSSYLKMNLKTIQESLKVELDTVNRLISDSLVSNVQLLNKINEYLFNTRGKQLRPLLSILSAKACGTPDLTTFRCAAVAEMIHTATLLHDDVADNSFQRRGEQTVQTKFSPASSVLTGDYWLAKALSMLVAVNDVHLMGFFTRAVEDLSEGELFQMQKATSMDTTEEDYLKIISRKTSSLFIAAIAGAAYTSGAPKHITKLMSDYAYHLGIAFQIRDDIFDYMPELDAGKNSGTDIKEKKITLPLICALNQAPEKESRALLSFIKETHAGEESLVNKSFDFVSKYSGITCAQNVLFRHSETAAKILSPLENSLYKTELEQIAYYVGNRLV